MRRKHDWVPRLSRLVEQQGERVTSRHEQHVATSESGILTVVGSNQLGYYTM